MPQLVPMSRSIPKTISLLLVALLVATIYGLIRTGDETGAPSPATASPSAAPDQTPLVDQSPLLTAQALAHMPTSSVEAPSAQKALQIADQELDLAFALAVLDATQHPPVLSDAAKRIEARLQRAEYALAEQQAQAARLTAEEAKASGAQKDALDDQLDLVKAQMELRQDEVDGAKQDLIDAGGDPKDRIQAMVEEHEAASQSSDTTKISVSAPTAPRGIVQRFQQWFALHRKQLQLWRARGDALSLAGLLASKHDALQRRADAQRERTPLPGTTAANAPTPEGAPRKGPGPTMNAGEKRAGPTHEQSAAILRTTKDRAAERKTVWTLSKRIDSENQLANVYGQWIGVVASEQRSLANGVLRGVLAILLIAIIGIFVNDVVRHLLARMSADRRQVEALRTVTRVSLQIVGFLLVLLVIFGAPTQLGTFLGLAGAGLTVALKDFIIAFFGWFVLMGKNGIRLGDWVEINGVTGEVAELGMFHTVLLETGNWTDSGHPTGRRVTFTNNFAVEGHYFNFSTSGQWLWDELQIVLPAGQNPYPIIEAIHNKVVEATSESTRQAEQEWRGAAKSRGMNALSAAPAVNVKPVIGGTELSIRYITRATDRSELRAKLNHDAVDLLTADPAQPHNSPTV